MKLMKKSIKKIILSLIFIWLSAPLMAQSQIKVYVTDAATGDSVPYVSLMYRAKKTSKIAGENGVAIIDRYEGQNLRVSAVGYKAKNIKITDKTDSILHVTLVSDSRKLGEVVVRGRKKHKYSRKNNPAVDLMRRVIAAKKRTELENNDYYQYNKYQRLTMAVNNITPDELDWQIFRDNPWLKNQIELCPLNQKFILPISVDETYTQHIYRKSPQSEKDIIKGQRTNGVSKLIQTGQIINTIAKDLFRDIDIYDDQIELLQMRFPSPIGSTAISFYHWYIEDTTFVDSDKCIHLQYFPANKQDMGFRGELYVVMDSTLHVKKCNMTFPRSTSVNFIDNMKMEQVYSKLPNGQWVLTEDNILAELQITNVFSKALVIRSTRLSDYDFNPIDKKLFRGKAKLITEPNAKMRDSTFWNTHRMVELSSGEKNIGNFLKAMSHTKYYNVAIFLIKAFVENFVETGSSKKPSKVDLGPVNTIISKNHVDGLRFRLSARTTANLWPHLFLEGYYAYGTKSKRHYYDAKVTYSFNKPEYQPIEFPIRTISLELSKDVESPSDKFLRHNKDNIFMALKPSKTEKMYFYNRQKLNFKWETDYGLAFGLGLKTENIEPASHMEFRRLSGDWVSKMRSTELSVSLDFRPGQTYINSKQRRVEANLNAPRFAISHTMGIKNFLGGDINSNYTEINFYKRLWFGSYGHFEIMLNGGAQWNKVPYFYLIMPPVNTSFFEHMGTFNLMEDMEFLNDRFLQFNLSWDLEGKLFNRVPLLKKLKWREYIAFKGMWGHLTSKNNPFLEENAGSQKLQYFPEGVNVMTNDPYMELVIGVHNIFKFLEVDYVRRLTYTSLPGIDKNGIRFGVNIVF